MPASIQTPNCLHIPPLYEAENALVFWETVEGAAGYELECSVNEDFADGGTGRTWLNISAAGKTWDEFASQSQSWNELAALPSTYTVYRGPGTDVPGPGGSFWWEHIDASDTDWNDNDAGEIIWNEVDALQTAVLSWDAMETRYRTWDEIAARQLTWNAFEELPPDTGTHKGCEIQVPFNKQQLWLRVRAYDASGGISAYKTATRRPVISAGGFVLVCPDVGRFVVQVDGRRVQNLADARFTLLYDAGRIRFEGLVKSGQSPAPKITSSIPGTIRFEYPLPIGTANLWDGPVAGFAFSVKNRLDTPLRLERVNAGVVRII